MSKVKTAWYACVQNSSERFGAFATAEEAYNALRTVAWNGAIVGVSGHVEEVTVPKETPFVTLAEHEKSESAKVKTEEVTDVAGS